MVVPPKRRNVRLVMYEAFHGPLRFHVRGSAVKIATFDGNLEVELKLWTQPSFIRYWSKLRISVLEIS